MTNRLCKQVSIESPATVGNGKEYVFQYDVMIPDTPPKGARIKVSRLAKHPSRQLIIMADNLLLLYRSCVQVLATGRDQPVSPAPRAPAHWAVTVDTVPAALHTVACVTPLSTLATRLLVLLNQLVQRLIRAVESKLEIMSLSIPLMTVHQGKIDHFTIFQLPIKSLLIALQICRVHGSP